MVLFSFSIPAHIPLILSGAKAQTTRQPRKPRKNGKKPYSVGEKVHLYYRSRQKKSCNNCLAVDKCEFVKSPAIVDMKSFKCPIHSNFFGESVITEIIHYSNLSISEQLEMYDKTHTALLGNEVWKGYTLYDAKLEEKEVWAKADGFQCFDEADEWFSNTQYAEDGKIKSYGKDWMKRDWDCIKWNGQHIARRVV